MTRTYLTEDISLIQKYFPGAKTVALMTPFDLSLSIPEDPWLLRSDDRDEPFEHQWRSEIFWSH